MRAQTKAQKALTIFLDDFENSLGKWSITPAGKWNLSTSYAYSGIYSARALYDANNANYNLASQEINLTTATNAKFRYLFRGSSESGYDYLYVEIKRATETTWTQLANYTGTAYEKSWWINVHNISSYIGSAIQVRFRFYTDSSNYGSSYGIGWYIDDVIVTEGATTVNILRPILAVPIIQEKGEWINVEVSADATSASEWSASISTAYDTFNLSINSIMQTSPKNWTLNVTIPLDAREDLYLLEVKVDSIVDREANAVSVVSKLKEKFTFIQITDTHIGSVSGGSTYNEMKRIIENETNLIKPDFVIITGDCCDKEPTWWSTQEFPASEQDLKFKELLHMFRVPVYVINGNHDYSYVSEDTGIVLFRRYINPYPDFSFKYGNFFFVGMDSGKYVSTLNSNGQGLTNEQITWLENQLSANNNSTQKFVFMHHPAHNLEHNSENYKALIRKYNVTFSLVGHTHATNIYDRDYKQITEDGSIGSPAFPLFMEGGAIKGSGGCYRIIRVNGSKIDFYTYDSDGNGVRDDTKCTPTEQLKLSYTPANNGTASSVTATITNNLREDFENAFVEFKVALPEAEYEYIVENGTIEQKLELPTMHVYYVRTNISKLSVKNVTIKRAIKYYLTFSPGWNFITLPLNVSYKNASQLADAISACSYVGRWSTSANKFDLYEKGYPEKDFVLENGVGYFVMVTEPTTLLIIGERLQSLQIALKPGWNSIGWFNSTSIDAKELKITNCTAVAYWDSTKHRFVVHTRGTNISNFYLERGYGYLVYVTKESTWIND
ncbi:MAG: metallophosphoesterase, partial [Candidatus Thermoplasmatota archaeon]|nr:metallophosphoesterase [Candidatus Thermoplasmatota archaeon]